jgi:hypothetical protein
MTEFYAGVHSSLFGFVFPEFRRMWFFVYLMLEKTTTFRGKRKCKTVIKLNVIINKINEKPLGKPTEYRGAFFSL